MHFPRRGAKRRSANAYAPRDLCTGEDYLPPGVVTGHSFDTMHDDPGVVMALYSADTDVLTTGFPYSNDYVPFVTVREGLVTRHEEFFDPLNWLVAQGATVMVPTADAAQ